MSKPNPWGSITVKTTDGQPVQLAEIWAKQKTVLYLVRRFGCALCQSQGSSMMELKTLLDKAGVTVQFVVVGAGTKNFSDRFKLGVPWEGSLFLDETHSAHKAINLKRFSAWQGFKRWFTPTALKYGKSLFARFKKANMTGDGLQSGGIFILGPEKDSAIEFTFLESESAVDSGADISKMYQLLTGKTFTADELASARESQAIKIAQANDLKKQPQPDESSPAGKSAVSPAFASADESKRPEPAEPVAVVAADEEGSQQQTAPAQTFDV